MATLISLKNFSFNYGNRDSDNIQRANIEIAPGQFVLVCGGTGSGKSTLLKAIVGLAPHFTGGRASGARIINRIDHSKSMPHLTADQIGYVNQQPEGSFVAETVVEELAFTMEQLGVPVNEMHTRLKTTLQVTGLEDLQHRKLTELSGGQQQRVAIAAALSAGQQILVLDEPTSALDPETAHELLEFIHHLCREQGLTAVIAEHRIERLVDLVDSVIVVSKDGTVEQGTPDQLLSKFEFVPPLIKLAQAKEWSPTPLSIEAAKRLIEKAPAFKKLAKPTKGASAVQAKQIVVRYGDVIAVDHIDFEAFAGESVAIMGENGSGKTSLLWKLRELLSDSAMVPQQASDLLFLNTMAAELADSDVTAKVPSNTTSTLFADFAGRLDPNTHPRDLSSGQQLALVLAMQLAKQAPVVLLDEPTRGLDYSAKQQVAAVIHRLKAAGKCVIFASHDVEFVALTADRVVQLSDGKCISNLPVDEALSYTGHLATQIAQIYETPGLITLEQVI